MPSVYDDATRDPANPGPREKLEHLRVGVLRAGQKTQNFKINIFEGWMSLTYMSY